MNLETDEFAVLLREQTNAQVAGELASLGYPVFPVRVWTAGGELKPIRGWREHASTDAAQVASWWRKWPDACVAMPTGSASGIAVLDLDLKKGKDGAKALAQLGFANLEALSPVRVNTPSGGWHFYFKDDSRLRTTADAIGRGIDVRAEGGFIFALGSSRDGRRYEIEASGLQNADLPAFPELLIAKSSRSSNSNEYTAPLDFDPCELKAVLAEIPAHIMDDRDSWIRLGVALHHQFQGSEEGFRLWLDTSARSPKYLENSSEKAERRRYEGFGKTRGKPATMLTVLQWAPIAAAQRRDRLQQQMIDGWLSELEALPSPIDSVSSGKHQLLTPAECAQTPSRGYIVKGFLAPRDVACVYGAPGAGKSLFCPHIGYIVAQGGSAFGMRTRAGLVLYVAAEDPHGMRGRVDALRRRHGDTDSFLLMEGVSDLLSTDSSDLAALHQVIDRHRPSLIVIDTLAMSFPGLEENSSDGMGKVIAISRSLTAQGAAVILVHHDTKAQTPTPRGHSSLNGALDVAIQLMPRDDSGIVRGKLSKNRNGACDQELAFKIDTEVLGIDDDGDPVTAALVREVDGSSRRSRPKLTSSETAALSILRKMAHPLSQRCDEASWRVACIEGRTVSGSDEKDSRRKATARAIRALSNKGFVDVQGGTAFLLAVELREGEPDAFDGAGH